MTILDLSLTPARAALLEGHDTEVHVLVAIAAPDAPATTAPRAPLNLAIVLDRSGSMAGRPLEEAKKCAEHMIRGLTPADRVAVVSFDDHVETVVPSQDVESQDRIAAAVRKIIAGGSTNLHGGWLAGAENVGARVQPGALSRVILLTDGQANVGESNPDRIADDCARLAAAGVTTSTYGLGASFNEDLLQAMASSGGGQSYFGETAEDLMDPFREEFDLMRAICARKIRLKLEAPRGVEASVLNLKRVDAEGRAILPDVAYGGVTWALVRLRVPAGHVETGRSDVHVLTAELIYETANGEQRSCAPAHLRLARVPVAAFGAVPEDPVVKARVQEVRGANLQDLARDAAVKGDWERVDTLIAEARFEAADNEWAQASISALETIAATRDEFRFSKEAAYKSAKMRARLYDRAEGVGYDEDLEKSKRSYLRRKPQEGKKFEE
ncbi:MAG: vWA domain-containing protein [Caulobacterales bacterium]